jgi:cytochrome P450
VDHRGLPSLTDPDLYANGDPHATWAVMRREFPVHWHDAGDSEQEPFWAITGYAPGLQVLTDWRTFSSTNGTFLRPNLSDSFPGGGQMLNLMDPPRHTLLRKVFSGLFTRRAIARMEPRVRDIARSLVVQALDAGACDFASDVASRLPLAVAAELLSVEPADVERISELNRLAAEHSSEFDGAIAQGAHLEILRYGARAVEKRRADPGADLVSAIVQAQQAGMDISVEEIVLTYDNVLFGVTETTRHTVSSGLLALLRHPRQLRALRGGEVSFESAVEEILRCFPAINHLLRTATTDTTLLNAEIRAGQPVTVWITSMNRDETVFDRADEFLIDRQPNRHLTFGGGMHFCLGAALARLMIRVLLEELLLLTDDITLTETPRRIPSHLTSGLETLPVTLRPRRPSLTARR